MKPYTVIGYWNDETHQPWIEHVTARSPKEAASIGVWKTGSEGDNRDLLEVVDVIAGHHNGLLCNPATLSGADVKDKIFKDKKLLPTYLGLSPSLDQAIEEALK